MLHETTTATIIRAFYNVYNEQGFGFAEKVYENSMMDELRSQGLKCEQQVPINVYYKGNLVGVYFADIVVNDEVILELKAASGLCEEHECQLLNYLKATDKEVGMLFNFGKIPQFKRKIFMNENKSRKSA
jgi:GxxExxY protein